MGRILPYIMENIKCLKPPTRSKKASIDRWKWNWKTKQYIYIQGFVCGGSPSHHRFKMFQYSNGPILDDLGVITPMGHMGNQNLGFKHWRILSLRVTLTVWRATLTWNNLSNWNLCNGLWESPRYWIVYPTRSTTNCSIEIKWRFKVGIYLLELIITNCEQNWSFLRDHNKYRLITELGRVHQAFVWCFLITRSAISIGHDSKTQKHVLEKHHGPWAMG